MVSPQSTFLVQQTIVLVGLVWTFFVMFRIAQGSKEKIGWVIGGILPHVVAALLLAFLQFRAMTFYFYN
jgi:hypothetical protein